MLALVPRDTDERPPYPGLAAFTSADHGSFFGREREVAELVNRLRDQPIVVVVGPSGSGKSSFLAAGVVPALPTTWIARIVRPGREPAAALATLDDAIAPYRGRDAAGVVVVDQAEELFTLARDDDAARFVAALATAARAGVRVVFGVRDDFLCRLEATWPEPLAVHVLRAPDASMLERVVAAPARAAGYELDDPELPREIARAVAGSPGALPLVAFVAAQLCELATRDRHFHRLTRDAYERLGGVTGALVRHADGAVDAMPASDRRLVRIAFRRLLANDGTRCVIGRDDLIASLDHPSAAEVVERMLAARLIVSRDEGTGDGIEVVHEALATTWPRLAEWRREDEAATRLHRRLANAARDWHERGRPHGLLWRDEALADVHRAPELGLTPIEAAFAVASKRAARATRRRAIVATAAVFVALAAGVVVLAAQRAAAVAHLAQSLEERGRLAVVGEDPARGLAYLAEARRLDRDGAGADLLVAHAAAALDGQRVIVERQGRLVDTATVGTALIATHAGTVVAVWDQPRPALGLPRSPTRSRSRSPATTSSRSTPHGAVSATGRDGRTRWRADVPPAPSGDAVAGIVAAGTTIVAFGRRTRVLDLADGRIRGELDGGAPVVAARVDAAGERVATVAVDGVARVWEAHSTALVATCAYHHGHVRVLALAGELLVTGGEDGDVVACDAWFGALVRRFQGHTGPVTAVQIASGRIASTSTDGTARIWDLASGLQITSLAGHHGAVYAPRFSPDGATLATAERDGTIRLWDTTGVQVGAFAAGALPYTLVWDTDGRGFVFGTEDGAVRHWNFAGGRYGITATLHAGAIHDLAVGTKVVTAGADGIAVDGVHHAIGDVATVRIDGDLLVAAAADGVSLWSLAGGGARGRLPVANAVAANASPIGIVTADALGAVRTWTRAGAPRTTAFVGFAPAALELDPSKRFAIAIPRENSTASELPVVDLATGAVAARLAGQAGYVAAIDASRIATCDTEALRIWELGTWRLRTTIPIGFCDELAFLPDGRLVGSIDDGRTLVWDADDGRLLAALATGGTPVASIAVSPDGALFATGSRDGVVRVWDAATTRALLVLPSHHGSAEHIAFTPDGEHLVSAGDDGRVVTWDVRHPRRSQGDLDRLIRCRVPYRFDGDDVLPHELAPGACD